MSLRSNTHDDHQQEQDHHHHHNNKIAIVILVIMIMIETPLAPPAAPRQLLRAVPESRDLAVSRLATTGDWRTVIMKRKRMMMMMALVTINDIYPHSETIHHLQPVPCAWFPSPWSALLWYRARNALWLQGSGRLNILITSILFFFLISYSDHLISRLLTTFQCEEESGFMQI